ncbi:MAG TPA: folylpolyglutamate synthase/dihydrofolate synthase family protein [Opitutaceae bacterium]|nr:folylpolyglutamate synthase/dihydrofolate synthase family protein [Opitutaceae bacterium]
MASELPLTGYPAVQEYLFGLKTAGVKFGVDRMRIFSASLDRPERAVPCIHVAGTNGKGSVSAMLESVLRASGCRTGLYTSPHLVRLGERVQVDRRILSEDEITAFVRELRPVADGIASRGGLDDRPSFFEFMTAMAFLQFARKRCDCSVIEVGLGGRLDATNIVEPEVCVVTSIGLDHCDMLGDTLEAIAGEKGGIIKTGRPVVIGRMPDEAETTLRNLAASKGARVVSVREEFGDDVERYPRTNLEGDYQRWNAATAALAAGLLSPGFGISRATIGLGLGAVDWPGRWQRTHLGGRLTILDASHNAEGAGVLDSNLDRLCIETGRSPVAIVGVLGAMRARPLLDVLCRHCRELYLVVPQQARASTHAELESLIPATFRGRTVRSTVAELFPAPGLCTAGARDDVIVLTGSIYLLGEVLARLEPQRGRGEGRLQDF